MAEKVYALDLGSKKIYIFIISMRVQISLSVWKNSPQTGIEPASFRLTAESSNHWATEDSLY